MEKTDRATAQEGGLLVGKSHKEGGIDIIVPEGKINAEGNELILTKGVYESKEKVGDLITPDMTKREAASALNTSEGGVKLAEKGLIVSEKKELDVLQERQAVLLQDFQFFTKRCPTRRHLRLAISQINKQYYDGKLDEELLYKACTSGRTDFYSIEQLSDGKNIVLIDKVYKLNNTASQGAKIKAMENLYYLKVGNLVKDDHGNAYVIVCHSKEGVNIKRFDEFSGEYTEVFILFSELISKLEAGRIKILGCIYENDRDKLLFIKEVDLIGVEHELAEYGKKISSLKQSHEDTMAGVDALAAKGAKIENQYKDKESVEAIWNAWTKEQREHFLNDHETLIPASKVIARGRIRVESFSALPSYYQDVIAEHVYSGQYGGGGKTPSSKGISALKNLTKSKGLFTAKMVYPKGGKKGVQVIEGADVKTTILNGKHYAKTISFKAEKMSRKEAIEFVNKIASKL